MRQSRSPDGKRKILFLLPSLQGGGAERVIVHLVNNISRDAFVPMLALGEVAGPYLSDLRADVNVYELGRKRSRDALLPIVRLVWRLRPDVVMSTLGLNIAVSVARSLFPRGVMVLLRQGNTASESNRDIGSYIFLKKLVYKHLYPRADRVICQSEFMRADLVKTYGVDRKNLVKIANPVDLERVRSAAAVGGNPYPGGGPHLLAVGRLSHQKGFDLLIASFKEIVQALPDATLTILGEGEQRHRLAGLASELSVSDKVRMPGFVSNPYRYMRHADVLVNSSRYEGLANVILEAHALGVPVVATTCPGGNQEVVDNGKNGWIVREESASALAEGILNACNELARLSRTAITAGCEERYSLENIVRQYERLFRGDMA